jgi:hypothetical protein
MPKTAKSYKKTSPKKAPNSTKTATKNKASKLPKAKALSKAVAPEPAKTELVALTPEEALPVLLRFVYDNPVNSLAELSEKTSISVSIIEGLKDFMNIDFVALSQFKEMFKVSLQMNIRKISLMIDSMTDAGVQDNKVRRASCDPFTLQKLTQSLKTLKDVLKTEDPVSNLPSNVSGDVRRVRISQITEIIEERYRVNKAVEVN